MKGHVCPPFVCFVKDSFIIKKKRKMYKRRKYGCLNQFRFTEKKMRL